MFFWNYGSICVESWRQRVDVSKSGARKNRCDELCKLGSHGARAEKTWRRACADQGVGPRMRFLLLAEEEAEEEQEEEQEEKEEALVVDSSMLGVFSVITFDFTISL